MLSPARGIERSRLEAMVSIAEAATCRRRILLRCFGEDGPENCGACDVCRNPPRLFDGTVPAQKLLSAVLAYERGEFPSWTLKVQIMPFEDAKTYRFNPFDLTKVWPHGDYPLIEVGKMTLNRNVTDYHTEMEQAAFQPNNMVPGTGLSPDKMLLARGFSYADAHRARLGVNYQQIPVNQPRVPVFPPR